MVEMKMASNISKCIKHSMLLVLILSCLVAVCLSAFAIKEGESEFFEYNDQNLVFTVLKVNQDGTADVMLSKPVPDFTKSLNVGESQRYYSNWQCFVTTLMKVENSKGNVYVSSCYDEDEEEAEIPAPAPIKPVTPAKVVKLKNTSSAGPAQTVPPQINTTQINDTQIIIPEEKLPTEQYPQESFLDRDVKLGNVLIAGLVFLMIVMIIMLVVFISVKKDDY